MVELLNKSAEKWPDKIAIKSNKEQITYKELKYRVDEFAEACLAKGLKSGDRIILLLENSIEAAIAVFGTLLAGGVIVCIHPSTPSNKLIDLIEDSKPVFLFSHSEVKQYNHIDDEAISYFKLKHIPFLDRLFWYSVDVGRLGEINEKQNCLKDIAAFIYTSGSTGKPKAIMSSHENIIFSYKAINKYLKNDSEDRVLSYLPLSFDYGLYQLFITLSTGGILVLERPTIFPGEIKNKINDESITCLPGLRSLLSQIIGIGTKHKASVFPKVRYVTNTGDSLPDRMLKELPVFFPKATIFLMYGLTECKRVSYSVLDPCSIKRGMVGVPLEHTNVVVKNDDGKLCDPFVVGELYVTGPHVCKGYWNKEDETKETFLNVDGATYLKTGDLFYQDEEGLLYYVGRRDKSFKSKGFRIDPKEIENLVISRIEEIYDAVVVGIPDDKVGHKIGLFVNVVEEERTDDLEMRMRKLISDYLEPWKSPSKIIFKEKVPLTQTGKIDRERILELMI
ncbi:class I adenylate-forming enzyme family protein [Paenibacillus sp. JGP012]|uniref:class I adenylate-forming enzyme family protein n=1 Tax=Paenibacillus sp. JGP012 TaxID=2735914 RepID=UPI00289359D9|nr:class I adenylate-forming enzyme family protein [Paenibacillus sp. JGP012]